MTVLSVASRLTETITIKRITGHSTGGDPVRGTTISSVPARIERGDGEGNITAGKDRLSDALVITEVAVILGDMLFFPEDNTADNNTGRLVKTVEQRRALDGTVTHYAAIC